MAQFNYDEVRTNRTIDLMSEFFVYDNKFTASIHSNSSFLDVHEWQIKAANIIHDLDEEGLLDKAKELYPWEKDTIQEYLECYKEINSKRPRLISPESYKDNLLDEDKILKKAFTKHKQRNDRE